jgi:hypothetical protein
MDYTQFVSAFPKDRVGLQHPRRTKIGPVDHPRVAIRVRIDDGLVASNEIGRQLACRRSDPEAVAAEARRGLLNHCCHFRNYRCRAMTHSRHLRPYKAKALGEQ